MNLIFVDVSQVILSLANESGGWSIKHVMIAGLQVRIQGPQIWQGKGNHLLVGDNHHVSAGHLDDGILVRGITFFHDDCLHENIHYQTKPVNVMLLDLITDILTSD